MKIYHTFIFRSVTNLKPLCYENLWECQAETVEAATVLWKAHIEKKQREEQTIWTTWYEKWVADGSNVKQVAEHKAAKVSVKVVKAKERTADEIIDDENPFLTDSPKVAKPAKAPKSTQRLTKSLEIGSPKLNIGALNKIFDAEGIPTILTGANGVMHFGLSTSTEKFLLDISRVNDWSREEWIANAKTYAKNCG